MLESGTGRKGGGDMGRFRNRGDCPAGGVSRIMFSLDELGDGVFSPEGCPDCPSLVEDGGTSGRGMDGIGNML